MKKELNYALLFQFQGVSAEVSLFLSNLHTTFNYGNFDVGLRDTHLYFGDKDNDLVWTLITYDNIKNIIYHEDSDVLDIMLTEGFISVCEQNSKLVDFELDKLGFE